MEKSVKREMATHVALILFTFGVYYFIWIYQTTVNLNGLTDYPVRKGWKELLLCLLLPGYQIYWFHQSASRMNRMELKDGNGTAIFILLSIFLPFGGAILFQDRLNRAVDVQKEYQDTLPISATGEASKRFRRIYELPGNQYLEDAPVVLREASLLCDTVEDKMLVQLSFTNIADDIIRAVIVEIESIDITGAVIGKAREYQILDLDAKRGDEFGQMSPIYLESSYTRTVRVKVLRVILEHSSWISNGEDWDSLSGFQKIDFSKYDDEFEKQWHLELGENAEYTMHEQGKIWCCVCGSINHADEETCIFCGNKKAVVRENTIACVEAKKEKRIAEEKENAYRMTKEKIAALRDSKLDEDIKIHWMVECLEQLNQFEDVSEELARLREKDKEICEKKKKIQEKRFRRNQIVIIAGLALAILAFTVGFVCLIVFVLVPLVF